MGQPIENNAHPNRELVSFRVADQDYCVDIMAVREIRGWTPATVLPRAPEYMMGVINLRGSVVPIVNLAARLGLPQRNPDTRQVIIITLVDSQLIGILVDAVSDILGIPVSEVQPPPKAASTSGPTFIEGIIARGDQMLRLLDLTAILPRLNGED